MFVFYLLEGVLRTVRLVSGFVALAVYAFRSVTVKSVLRLRFKASFSVALRPQRLYGLLGTEIKSKVTDLWRFKVHSFEAMAG